MDRPDTYPPHRGPSPGFRTASTRSTDSGTVARWGNAGRVIVAMMRVLKPNGPDGERISFDVHHAPGCPCESPGAQDEACACEPHVRAVRFGHADVTNHELGITVAALAPPTDWNPMKSWMPPGLTEWSP